MADHTAERFEELIRPLRIKPGSKVDLVRDFDPGYKVGFVKKKDGAGLLRAGVELLAGYQPRLAAQDTYGVLVCLQALDAGGKDGTIRHVMSGVNPQGVHVTSFMAPSAGELGHDYLWRHGQMHYLDFEQPWLRSGSVDGPGLRASPRSVVSHSFPSGGSCPSGSPSSRARAMAWRRVAAASSRLVSVTCARTVAGDTNRRVPAWPVSASSALSWNS
jgi:Polyphosphate kinase 2 (PPK2)